MNSVFSFEMKKRNTKNPNVCLADGFFDVVFETDREYVNYFSTISIQFHRNRVIKISIIIEKRVRMQLSHIHLFQSFVFFLSQ